MEVLDRLPVLGSKLAPAIREGLGIVLVHVFGNPLHVELLVHQLDFLFLVFDQCLLHLSPSYTMDQSRDRLKSVIVTAPTVGKCEEAAWQPHMRCHVYKRM